jgi:hypothetical protein
VMIHQWQSEYNPDKLPLKTVFEKGTKHKGDLIDVIDRDSDCPIPTFESKKDVIALQSADLLAWQMLWIYKNNGNIRPEFERLLKHPNDFNFYTKNDLMESCKKAGVPLRSDIPPGQKFVFYHSPKKVRSRELTYSSLSERDKFLTQKRKK